MLLYAPFFSLSFSQTLIHSALFFLFLFFIILDKTKVLFGIISSNVFPLYFHIQLSFSKYILCDDLQTLLPSI